MNMPIPCSAAQVGRELSANFAEGERIERELCKLSDAERGTLSVLRMRVDELDTILRERLANTPAQSIEGAFYQLGLLHTIIDCNKGQAMNKQDQRHCELLSYSIATVLKPHAPTITPRSADLWFGDYCNPWLPIAAQVGAAS